MGREKGVNKGLLHKKAYLRKIQNMCGTSRKKMFLKLTNDELRDLVGYIEEAQQKAIDEYKKCIGGAVCE